MTKKILSAMMALAMLFIAACQNELDTVAAGGDTSVVTFNIETPELATRAYSDGKTADVLHYAIFDLVERNFNVATGTYLENQKPNTWPTLTDKKATVSFKLVTGNMYRVVFWAAAPNAPYTFTANDDGATVTVDYTNAVSNAENRDAFYKCYDFAVDGNKTIGVKLERPFAQLNIGTSDYTDAADANVVLEQSKVKVKGIANELNLFTGAVSGNETVTFNYAATPYSNDGDDDNDEKFPVQPEVYKYIAMNYILVGATDPTVVDVEFACIDTKGRDYSRTVGSVPVQGNYRTNIYGQIFTSTADLEVEIVPGYGENDQNDHIVEVWDGKTTKEPAKNNETNTYTVSTGSELAWLAARVNGTASTRADNNATTFNIELNANIDLGGNNWTPIGTEEKNFTGTFNGNGYVINNLKIEVAEAKEGKAFMGFFGYAKNATIKNVTFNNVNINVACLDIDHSQGHIGAVAGSLEGKSTIENVTVKGDIKVEATTTANGASRVAVVAGGNSYGDVTMNNVHVIANEGSYLKANNNVGALAGQLQGKSVFDNCSSNIDVTGTKFFAGGIIGLAAGDQLFTNCHTTGDVTITAGRSGKAHDHYRVGGIAGGWADGAKNVCTLTNCSYEGELSGTNADGSVAEVLDYAGYVGRGYTLNGCAGSKVVIGNVEGDVEYVQLGNTAAEAGVYIVNDVCEVGTAAAFLIAVGAAKDGLLIKLTDNITFDKENRTNSGGTWYEGVYYIGDKDFTIDLNGKTIAQNGAVNDYMFLLKNDGTKANTITLKNGTIDAGTAAYCALATSTTSTQKITINTENITFVNNNSNGAVLKIRGGAELNVKAGTIITAIDSYTGIEAAGNNTVVNIYEGAKIYQNGKSSYLGSLAGASGNATINVKGGEGTSAQGCFIAMTSGGTINVEGGEWIANTDGTIINGSNKGVLIAQSEKGYKSIVNVTGGTFKGGYCCYGAAVGDAQINIKGGNFNADPKNYVVAGYEVTGNYTVGKPQALVALEEAIADGGNVTLTNDVTLLESLKIENTVVLDLNGKTITAPLFSAFEVKKGGELTIKNGKVVAYESTVRAIGGKAVIESGEYTSTGTALDSPATYRYSLDCRENGELIVNGGTFKSNNGMINVSSTVTINGGKFENIVEKSTTRHFAYVSAPLTINDGEFIGKANSAAGGCFFCGAGAGGDIQIKGGKFTSLWTSGSVNRIFEVYFGGAINVTGGMFNTNGGIATFVTENTDEATKAAYPYAAK